MRRLAFLAALALLTTAALAPQGERARAAEQPWYTAAVAEAPTPHGPPNGTLLQGFGAITLSFDLPDGATQYHLQVIPFHGDGPGVNLIRNPESSFTLQPPTLGIGPYVLLPGMTYTWRLRASDATTSISDTDRSWGPWSDEWSFTTPQATTASIRPADPPPGVTVSSLTPSLSWTDDNAFIFYYEIQLSKDELFDTNPRTANASVFFNLVHGGESRPFNSWAVPAAYPLEQGIRYFWRVRPRVQGNGAPVNWPQAFWFTSPARGGSPTPTATPTACPDGRPRNPTADPCGTITPTLTPTPTVTPVPSTTPTPPPPCNPCTLIVTTQGTGSGSVRSLPAGINCPPICSASYNAGTVVTLTATPLGGSRFLGWSGDPDCSDGTLVLAATTSCIAVFEIGTDTQQPTLFVAKQGPGSGTITSSPPGINCGPDCQETYQAGTVVSLTAIASSGSQFAGWTGDPDCTDGQVTMNSSKTCTALFESFGTPTPTLTPTPTPTATPTPTPTSTTVAIYKTDASSGAVWSAGEGWPPREEELHAGPGFGVHACKGYPLPTSPWYMLGRSFLSFDTSVIPPSAQILSAVLDFYALIPSELYYQYADPTTIEVVSASQGSALEVADYGRVGSTSFGSMPFASLRLGERNLLALSGPGLAYLNRAGNTQLGLRFGLDLRNERPTGCNEFHPGNDLRLQVTYR